MLTNTGIVANMIKWKMPSFNLHFSYECGWELFVFALVSLISLLGGWPFSYQFPGAPYILGLVLSCGLFFHKCIEFWVGLWCLLVLKFYFTFFCCIFFHIEFISLHLWLLDLGSKLENPFPTHRNCFHGFFFFSFFTFRSLPILKCMLASGIRYTANFTNSRG